MIGGSSLVMGCLDEDRSMSGQQNTSRMSPLRARRRACALSVLGGRVCPCTPRSKDTRYSPVGEPSSAQTRSAGLRTSSASIKRGWTESTRIPSCLSESDAGPRGRLISHDIALVQSTKASHFAESDTRSVMIDHPKREPTRRLVVM
jgi:hypothetical protein